MGGKCVSVRKAQSVASVAIGFCAPLCVARKQVGVGELMGVPEPAAGAGGRDWGHPQPAGQGRKVVEGWGSVRREGVLGTVGCRAGVSVP